MALFITKEIIRQHKTEGIPVAVIDEVSSHEEFLNIQGSFCSLTKGRVETTDMIVRILCGSSCTGKPCYSSNPGCQLEEIISEMHFRHWNKLLGLADD